MPKIVTSDIPFGSAYAYRKGDSITDDALKAHPEWADYVAGSNTQAAREAQGLPEPEKTETTAPAGGKDK